MPIFEIQGKDGKTYEAEAPNIEAVIAALGLNTPNSRIEGAHKDAANAPKHRLSTDPEFFGPKRPTDYGLTDYLAGSVPFGDEVAAAGGAIGQQLAELTGRSNADTSFGESYNREKALRGRYREEYQEANPGKSLGAHLATLPTVGPGVGAIPATLGGRMGQAAAGGAGVGALYGAGEGQGLTERAKNAAWGAGVGAVTGGLAPPLIEGATGLVSRALSPATTAIANRAMPKRRATRIVEEALRRDAVPPVEAARRLVEQRRVNPEVVLADVAGANTRGLARAAVNTPGAARERVTDFVMMRNLRQPQRITDAVTTILRNPNDFGRTVARMSAEREKVASPIYRQAFQNSRPVNVSGVVRYIDQKVRPGVNQMVSPLADLRPDGITATLGKLRSYFATSRNQRFDLEALHRVKMELDGIIGPAMRSGDTTLAREVLGVQNRLLKAMDSASTDYKRARQIYSSTHAMENALEVGRNVFRMTADDVRGALQGMTAGEREMVQIGLARAIRDQAEKATGGFEGVNSTNLLRTVFNSPKVRGALRAAFQNDQAFRRFQAVMMREGGMRRTADAVTGNSTTTRQLADLIETQSGAAGRDVFSQLMEGKPWQALTTAVRQAIFGERGITEKVANRIADMLLSNNPQLIADALRQLQQRTGAVRRLAQRMSAIERFATTEITGGATKALAGTR